MCFRQYISKTNNQQTMQGRPDTVPDESRSRHVGDQGWKGAPLMGISNRSPSLALPAVSTAEQFLVHVARHARTYRPVSTRPQLSLIPRSGIIFKGSFVIVRKVSKKVRRRRQETFGCAHGIWRESLRKSNTRIRSLQRDGRSESAESGAQGDA